MRKWLRNGEIAAARTRIKPENGKQGSEKRETAYR